MIDRDGFFEFNHEKWERFYYIVKFSCKSLNFNPPDFLVLHFLNIGQLCLQVLQNQNEKLKHNDKISQNWYKLRKGSTFFFYCHSLKWCLKYLEILIIKIVS